MQIQEKYPEIPKIIRRLAYNCFHYKTIIIGDLDNLLNKIKEEHPYLNLAHINNIAKIKIMLFYIKMVDYFNEKEKDINNIVLGDYITNRDYLSIPLNDLKHRILFDNFVLVKCYPMTLYEFSDIFCSEYTISASEMKELYTHYINMFWFCKGIFSTDSDNLCLPEFMFNEII